MNPRRIAWAVAAGVAAGLGVRYLRHFPWALSGVVALAVGILTGMTLRTVAQLREIWDRDRR
ncbi:MAG: hypothetical protein H6Q03_1689 [Acidobacteria bacterium]|nr:hypothetical protein [Acidobacteriota bacterium]